MNAFERRETRVQKLMRKLEVNGTPCGKLFEGRGCRSRKGKDKNEQCLQCKPYIAAVGDN